MGKMGNGECQANENRVPYQARLRLVKAALVSSDCARQQPATSVFQHTNRIHIAETGSDATQRDVASLHDGINMYFVLCKRVAGTAN